MHIRRQGYEAIRLSESPHNPVSVCALRSKIPTHGALGPYCMVLAAGVCVSMRYPRTIDITEQCGLVLDLMFLLARETPCGAEIPPRARRALFCIQHALWTGVPRSKETAFSQDPTIGLCQGSHDGPAEVNFLMNKVSLYRVFGSRSIVVLGPTDIDQ